MFLRRSPGARLARRMIHRALALACLAAYDAQAHEGPPFPILVDQAAAGYRVSVWADPDIGEAFFYVILETPDGKQPDRLPTVSMWTEPVSGRLERTTYEAEKQKLKSHVQFAAEPYFDQRDLWNVGFEIEPTDGEADVLVAQVESTPPGYGPWDLAIYLFPFVFLGGMWIIAMRRRLRARDQASEQGSHKTRVPAAIACQGDV